MMKFYNSVKLCVRSLGKVLDCFDSYVGVKQGEPLSPLLFILFLNDVADELNVKVNASSFDDSKYCRIPKFCIIIC